MFTCCQSSTRGAIITGNTGFDLIGKKKEEGGAKKTGNTGFDLIGKKRKKAAP